MQDENDKENDNGESEGMSGEIRDIRKSGEPGEAGRRFRIACRDCLVLWPEVWRRRIQLGAILDV